MSQTVALSPRREPVRSRARRVASCVLFAVAAFLAIAATASARAPGVVIGAAGSPGAASLAPHAPRPHAPCGGIHPATGEIEAEAADAEFGPGRIGGPAVGSSRKGRVSYRPARAVTATPLALGSPLRPPRGSA